MRDISDLLTLIYSSHSKGFERFYGSMEKGKPRDIVGVTTQPTEYQRGSLMPDCPSGEGDAVFSIMLQPEASNQEPA